MNKNLSFIALGTVLLGAALVAVGNRVYVNSAALAKAQTASDEATRRDEIKRTNKTVLWSDPDRGVLYPTIKELARRSPIVFVGRTIYHRSRLTKDGSPITTDFWVRVQEVFKGGPPTGSIAVITLPGGSHRYSDGTIVSHKTRSYLQAQDGKSYLFFLQNKAATVASYQLMGGVQGLFELDTTRAIVLPADISQDDPIARQSRNKPMKAFLDEIRGVIRSEKDDLQRRSNALPQGGTR